MALAFFREGLSLNNAAYQCLSFFKVLNLLLGNGKKHQIPWMDANFKDAMKDNLDARDWETKVQLGGQSVGEYLYGSNRSAVAHAEMDPIVDPDDPEDDRRRMENDLPMVRSLAERCIETSLNIKTSMTTYREHLYELAGFKVLFGVELVARIVAEEEVPPANFPELPTISLRLVFEAPYQPFQELVPSVVDCANGMVGLMLDSADGLVSVLIGLDFTNERLEFDFGAGIGVDDDGSLLSAQNRLSLLKFRRRYIGNGILELWANGQIVSRKDAYLPMDIDMGATDRNYGAMIQRAEADIAARLPQA